jgi:hypothetical protein
MVLQTEIELHECAHGLAAHASGFHVQQINVPGRHAIIVFPRGPASLASAYARDPQQTLRETAQTLAVLAAGDMATESDPSAGDSDAIVAWAAAWRDIEQAGGPQWVALTQSSHRLLHQWMSSSVTQTALAQLADAVHLKRGIVLAETWEKLCDRQPAAIALWRSLPWGKVPTRPETATLLRTPERPLNTTAPTVSSKHTKPASLPTPSVSNSTSQPAAERSTGAPKRVWMDSYGTIITCVVMADGTKHYPDGRRIARDGRTEYRPEWVSKTILLPNGKLRFDK